MLNLQVKKVLFLSKEASNKNERLKIEMMLSMKDDKVESSTERVWKENVFLDIRELILPS